MVPVSLFLLFMLVWTPVDAQGDVYSTFYLYGNETCTGTPLQMTSSYVLLGQCTPASCGRGIMITCTNAVPSLPKGFAVSMSYSKPTCSAGQPTLVVATVPNTCISTPSVSSRYDIGSSSIRARFWSNPSCSGTAPVDGSVNFGCTVVGNSAQLVYVSNFSSSLTIAWAAFVCFAALFL